MDVSKVNGFVNSVLSQHKAAVADIAIHQSAFLELAAFVATYEHYRLAGLGVRMVHPRSGALTVKTTTRGHPSKFSRIDVRQGTLGWEAHMNLPVRGAYGDGIFCVDVAVVVRGAVPQVESPRSKTSKWLACENADLISFAEVKKLVVYPMLLAQFVGIVHEILPGFLAGKRRRAFKRRRHFEPALLALGNYSGNSSVVVDSFRKRGMAILVIPAFDVKLGRIRAGSTESPFELTGAQEDGT